MTTSRPSAVMPDASQPKIIGSRSAGNPTPRSDHTSWWFSAAAFTVTSTQPRRRGQFDLAHPESLQRIRGIQAGGIRSDHALSVGRYTPLTGSGHRLRHAQRSRR